jgi:uncharacterized protein YsxB (DUF464 family)
MEFREKTEHEVVCASMGFYITHILEAILLLLNSIAILNEKRFLKKCK